MNSNILAQSIEELFKKIHIKKELTSEILLELHTLFGNALVQRALDILDKCDGKIVRFIVNESLQLYQIVSANGIYKIYPNVNYCPCNSFKFQVINNRSQYTCKHILAIKLAEQLPILNRIQNEMITVDDFKSLLCND